MKRILRIILMIVVLVGLVGLARNQVAWAANSSGTTASSAPQWVEKSILPGGDVDCDKPWNKNKDKCKKKDKDKDRCRKNKKHCGTVKPPPSKIIIPVTGEYSVGGFCTISVALNDPSVKLEASLKTPLPGGLPDEFQKASQGCILTYFSGSDQIDSLPSDSGTATVCFAAPPGRNMTLFFYNNYSANPGWQALETTVEAGRACAPGNASGLYTATSHKP